MKKTALISIIIFALAAISSLTAVIIINYYSHKPNHITIAVPMDDKKSNTESKNFEYLFKCKELYEKQNEGVTIHIERIPVKSYSEWLSTSLIYSEAPDIFSVLPSDFFMLSSMHILEDLNDMEFDRSIPSNITKPWNTAGKQYAIPYYTDPPCIIVNKGLLKGGYVTLKASSFDWMDLFYTCKFFTKDIDNDGVNDYFGVTNIDWQTMVYANGQTLFDYTNSKAFFNERNVEFAVKYAVEMNRLNLDNFSDSFEKGRAVMKVTTLSQARYYIEQYPSLNLEILKFPHGPDGEFLSVPYDTPLAVNAKGNQKDLARDFIRFLVLNYDRQMGLFSNTYDFPVMTEALASSELLEELKPYTDKENLQTIIQSEMITIDFPQYYRLMSIADKEIFQFVKFEVNIKSALAALNQQIADTIKSIKQSG